MLIAGMFLAMMAPSPMAQVDATRAAFTKCLRDDMKKSLEAKMSAGEYDVAIKSKCETERAAFRAAVIALDQSGGDSAKAAAEDADTQIEDYHANFSDKFKDYSETNTMPG